MIGTGDTIAFTDGPCGMIRGSNRYERAQTFYAFCDSNAVNRGTTLKWAYAEVPGIGHDENGLYNTKACLQPIRVLLPKHYYLIHPIIHL